MASAQKVKYLSCNKLHFLCLELFLTMLYEVGLPNLHSPVCGTHNEWTHCMETLNWFPGGNVLLKFSRFVYFVVFLDLQHFWRFGVWQHIHSKKKKGKNKATAFLGIFVNLMKNFEYSELSLHLLVGKYIDICSFGPFNVYYNKISVAGVHFEEKKL